MVVLSKFSTFLNRYPIVRGIISYGTIWPTSSIIHQTVEGKTLENYDWIQALRYSFFGGIIIAPTLYGWIQFLSRIWPKNDLKTALTKAVIDQMSYSPAALATFYFSMNIMEGKGIEKAKEETRLKFFPTWRVGMFYWPIVHTCNFLYIPEKNRVLFTSVFSLIFGCFLSYMHHSKIEKNKKD